MNRLMIIFMVVLMFVAPVASALEKPSFAEFDAKAASGEARLNVVFFGGSFTWGAGASDPQRTSWRGLMMQYLLERYPKGNFAFHDATVGGTGSQLGVFRLERDVLSRKPDLVFLDFCANDGAWSVDPATLATYEHLLRRLVGANVCVVHAFFGGKDMLGAKYDPERTFARRTYAKRLSAAYDVPEGDLFPLLQDDWKAGKADLDRLWTQKDGTHPDDAGYRYFFDCVRLGFEDAVRRGAVSHVPAEPVFGDVENVRRIELAKESLPAGWTRDFTLRNAAWFDGLSSRWMDEAAVFSGTNAVPLRVKTRGQLVGFFGEGHPDGLSFDVIVDGKKVAHHGTKLGFGQLFVYRSSLDRDWKTNPHDTERTIEIVPVVDPKNPKGTLRLGAVFSAVLKMIASPEDGKATDVSKTVEQVDHSRAN